CHLLLLHWLSAPCLGQGTVPDTPAGRQFAAWLALFNRGDRDAYKEFIDKNYPSDPQPVDREMAFREMTGGFDVKQVEPSKADTQAELLLQGRNSDQFARIVVVVEPAEPHRIVDLAIAEVPRPAAFPVPHLSVGDLIAAVRKRLDLEAAAGRFSGTVLIARNGQSVLAEAVGVRVRD